MPAVFVAWATVALVGRSVATPLFQDLVDLYGLADPSEPFGYASQAALMDILDPGNESGVHNARA